MTNQTSFFYRNSLRGTKDFIGFTYTAVREPFQEESRWPLSSSTKWSSSNRDIGFQMASPSLFPYIYICMYSTPISETPCITQVELPMSISDWALWLDTQVRVPQSFLPIFPRQNINSQQAHLWTQEMCLACRIEW